MLVKVNSSVNVGIKAIGIDVEVNISTKGLPAFDIVGLPGKTVAESRERVRTAIINSGFEFPNKRITVNLAPADVQKDGSYFDLPIAIGILSAVYDLAIPKESLFYGELSLDGSLRYSHGVFLISIYAQESRLKHIFIPEACKLQATEVFEGDVFPIETLQQLFSHLNKQKNIKPFKSNKLDEPVTLYDVDLSEIIGQEQAKRALEVALAGGHNLAISGPPGVGKSMLSRAIPSLLPSLTVEESIEITKIYSAAGLIPPNGGIISQRQCRSPHHTISYSGLIGGGIYPKPGEISLAHRGVLFLDEFPEFSRKCLESLRQPLEDGLINITRSSTNVTFPCKFMLVAAFNPCPCGYLGSSSHKCTCSASQVLLYSKRLSGPILDRIDIFSKVGSVDTLKLNTFSALTQSAEKSESIRARILSARRIQQDRFLNEGIYTNSEMKNKHVDKFCRMTNEARDLLQKGINRLKLSPRSYFKLIKVARTISDLESSTDVSSNHIAEALTYKEFS